VDGLKEEFPDQLLIVSVDVQSSLGRELAGDYGKFTPTFVFFDPQGVELWRSIGSLDPEDIREYFQ
jgi:hypothetical protein